MQITLKYLLHLKYLSLLENLGTFFLFFFFFEELKTVIQWKKESYGKKKLFWKQENAAKLLKGA